MKKLNKSEKRVLNKFLLILNKRMCWRCNKEKQLKDFSTDVSRPGGVQKMCKKCNSIAVSKITSNLLSDNYLKNLTVDNFRNEYGLNISKENIPQEYVEAKREVIKLSREIKSKNYESQESKESGVTSPSSERRSNRNSVGFKMQQHISAKISTNRSPLFKHNAKRNAQYFAEQTKR